ncbi:MAG: glycerophosphodiester phosphodiesterase family protein [Hyphomicrobiaceae bacterium]
MVEPVRHLRDVFGGEPRPIAHRGLHDAGEGRIENTWPAFAEAIRQGFAIECDIQASADGVPIVHHDSTLDRLTDEHGPLVARTADQLAAIHYRAQDERLIALEDLIERIDGKVPLIVEIKTDWVRRDPVFIANTALACRRSRGPIAVKSFDPDAIAEFRNAAPGVMRGIVAGNYVAGNWWSACLSPERQAGLTHLFDRVRLDPQFISYHVGDLPSSVVRYLREVCGLAVMAWTVRTRADWDRAARYADAPVFEGLAVDIVQDLWRIWPSAPVDGQAGTGVGAHDPGSESDP